MRQQRIEEEAVTDAAEKEYQVRPDGTGALHHSMVCSCAVLNAKQTCCWSGSKTEASRGGRTAHSQAQGKETEEKGKLLARFSAECPCQVSVTCVWTEVTMKTS